MKNNILKSSKIWIYFLYTILFLFICRVYDIFSYTAYEVHGEIMYKLKFGSLVLPISLYAIGFIIIYYFNLIKSTYRSLKQQNFAKYFASVKRFKWIALIIISLLIAIFQVYTIWEFDGERVDENALFLYSIGFFGGDFDPHWYVYGSLGMYLLYAVFVILYIPMYVIGKFSNIDEYAMQVFYNGYFIVVARYVFAVFSVYAVFLYSKAARYAKIPILLILVFVIFSITGYNAIFFANFLRCDMLVSFFIALMIYAATKSDNPKYMYLMALAVAGAISSKISALPIVLFLGVYMFYRLYDKTISWRQFAYIGLLFLLLLIIFQPYVNYFERITFILKKGSQGVGGGQSQNRINWGKVYHYTVLDRFNAFWKFTVKHVSLPILYCLVLLVFSKKYLKILLPSLLALILLLVPYINSPEITYYWFAPVYVILYFLALIGVSGFVDFVNKISYSISNKNFRHIRNVVLGIVTTASLIYVVTVHIPNYLKNYNGKEANNVIATRWIEKNLLEKENILLDENYPGYMPRVYDRDNYSLSKKISRVFMYNRDENRYLDNIFNKYLRNCYYERLGIDSIASIEGIGYIDIKDSTQIASIMGKYFITSVNSYKRYLVRTDRDLSDNRKVKLYNYKQYYNFMTSQPLVKRFSEGRHTPIEIYHIINKPQNTEEW